jgi:hypothetical protein
MSAIDITQEHGAGPVTFGEAASTALIGSAAVLAQTVPQVIDPGFGGFIGSLGNLGVVGILVWHFWYNHTHTNPHMVDMLSANVEKHVAGFGDQTERLREAFAREQNELREHNSRETGELRSMLIQNLNEMRRAVHDVKDTAQLAMNKTTENAVLDRADRMADRAERAADREREQS